MVHRQEEVYLVYTGLVYSELYKLISARSLFLIMMTMKTPIYRSKNAKPSTNDPTSPSNKTQLPQSNL